MSRGKKTQPSQGKPKPPRAPEPENETPYQEYERQCSDELAFFGHRDAAGNIMALTATSAVPSRADLITGWMAVPVTVSRYVEGVGHVTSPLRYPTREEAERVFPELAAVERAAGDPHRRTA